MVSATLPRLGASCRIQGCGPCRLFLQRPPDCNTVMAHNKNRSTFSKAASCSYALNTRGPWTVTLDLENGTATPYMEGENSGCQRALLFLPLEAPQSARRGFVLIHLFLWKYRACMSSRRHFVCLVFSFRYNGLAALALEAFGRVRALRARCGPFGPAMH